MNTGDQALQSSARLLTTVAYRLNCVTQYALEGSIFIAGAAIKWLRDNMKFIDTAAQTEEFAEKFKKAADIKANSNNSINEVIKPQQLTHHKIRRNEFIICSSIIYYKFIIFFRNNNFIKYRQSA